MEKFEKLLGKDSPLLVSIKQRGYEEPSEIQELSIPDILKGNDVIAGAATGSGKTLAFAVGLVNNVKKDCGTQGLVLTPTRELAEQVANELFKFSELMDLDIVPIYGGVSINNQIRRLPTAEIIVGTPGRILDHLNRNTINLSKINTLVLDEADRMLDMGFRDDVEKIVRYCSKQRQTLLFSATIGEEVIYLSRKYMKNPVEISAEPQVDPKKLKQVYYDVPDNLKYSLLKHLLENEKANLIMIFCNTRRNVDFVANNLKALGIEALPIHGGFSQEKRTRVLSVFHSKKVHVLVCTDVAARGLDIKGVSHIYNYDIPPSVKEYTHRIGRTARAGKEGIVINILASRDYENFQPIINSEFNITPENLPYLQRVEIKWVSERKRYGASGRFFGRNRERNYSRRDNREDSRRIPHRRENSGDSRRSYHSRENRGHSRVRHA